MFTSPPRSSTWSLSCRVLTKTLYSLSPISATFPAHLMLLDVIARIIFSDGTNHKAPLCAVFSRCPLGILMGKKDLIYELIYEYGVMRRAVASDILKSSRLFFSFLRLAYLLTLQRTVLFILAPIPVRIYTFEIPWIKTRSGPVHYQR